MSTNTPVPPIKLKLTYNKDRNMPRNFFVHIYDVPSDVEVRITAGEEEISFTKSEGYVRAGFWVAQDTSITIAIVQGETVLRSGACLVHNDIIYEHGLHQNGLDLFQTAYMY